MLPSVPSDFLLSSKPELATSHTTTSYGSLVFLALDPLLFATLVLAVSLTGKHNPHIPFCIMFVQKVSAKDQFHSVCSCSWQLPSLSKALSELMGASRSLLLCLQLFCFFPLFSYFFVCPVHLLHLLLQRQ